MGVHLSVFVGFLAESRDSCTRRGVGFTCLHCSEFAVIYNAQGLLIYTCVYIYIFHCVFAFATHFFRPLLFFFSLFFFTNTVETKTAVKDFN